MNDWIQNAIKKPNALKKTLKVKAGQKIPLSKLKKAASGKLGLKIERRARLALTLLQLLYPQGRDCKWNTIVNPYITHMRV